MLGRLLVLLEGDYRLNLRRAPDAGQACTGAHGPPSRSRRRPLGAPGDGRLYGAPLFAVLRSLANGGSSLTGLEAISNGISAFREPEGQIGRAHV